MRRKAENLQCDFFDLFNSPSRADRFTRMGPLRTPVAVVIWCIQSSVAELLCNSAIDTNPLVYPPKLLPLSCPSKQVAVAIQFADYGTPSGNCSAGLISSWCTTGSTVRAAVSTACLGLEGCAPPFGNSYNFGDPCPGYQKVMAVQVRG